MPSQGIVYLVGAGPGDAGLLTVKALRLIEQADVVVYDRLVSPEVLALIPPGVTRIAVGKAPGHHCVPQAQINELLVSVACKGRRVVRLKGGDPFIFGRGSEEALHLKHQGIPFEIVPGVTSAAAASAYAGIPLTHRGLSRTVHLVTGHQRDDEPLDLPWDSLAAGDATLAVYMGLANLRTICDHLTAAGMDPATPAGPCDTGGSNSGRDHARAAAGTGIPRDPPRSRGIVRDAGARDADHWTGGPPVQLTGGYRWSGCFN